MKPAALLLVIVLAWPASGQPNQSGFVAGHIFVSEFEAEACYPPLSRDSFIREIDPASGESWILADTSAGLCAPNGLGFTPDGKHLRVLNFLANTIMDFDSAGDGTITYTYKHGLLYPAGQNGLAFDAAGNFYVANAGRVEILKFPVAGGRATVFADIGDGILSGAGLAFALNGDLFVANRIRRVLRFTPQGEVSVFELFPLRTRPKTLAFDGDGNLFLGIVADFPVQGSVYRYDGGLLSNKRLLTSGFDTSSTFALTVSADGREVYVVDSYAVYGVDAEHGATRLIFQFPTSWPANFGGTGIAVYIPPPLGDLNCDGKFDGADIDAFFLALGDPPAYAARYPHCAADIGDMNCDGALNGADIDPFFQCLGAGGCTCP